MGLRFFWIQDHSVLSVCWYFSAVVVKLVGDEESLVGLCSLLQVEADEALSDVVYIYIRL